jgi:hypothetical protein
MATSKRDDLAKRFADRLQSAAPRGEVAKSRMTVDSRPDSRPEVRLEPRPERLGRGASGGRLRGHLVPHALHADARRLKLAQQARRGRRVTWDDVATEALDLLLADRGEIGSRLNDVHRLSDQATAGPRLVQATIPADLDIAFSELRLDLADELGRDVPYEQLWSAALLIWSRAHR